MESNVDKLGELVEGVLSEGGWLMLVVRVGTPWGILYSEAGESTWIDVSAVSTCHCSKCGRTGILQHC